jgi:hypothetical protein
MDLKDGLYWSGSVLSNILNKGAAEGAKFIKDHIIRVTEKAFDDFAAAGKDQRFNKKVLGLI